jgi:hypothetical protein
MYEFHGWCALRDSTYESDEVRLSQAVSRVQDFIAQLDWSNGFCFLQPFNGEHFVHLGGFQNRPRKEAEDIRSLLELIAREAPGSYGLLYAWDDENHEPPGGTGWRVWILARGKVAERFDPFLSPTQPVIED